MGEKFIMLMKKIEKTIHRWTSFSDDSRFLNLVFKRSFLRGFCFFGTLVMVGLLAGCATHGGKGSSVLPEGGPTMSEIYNNQNDESSDVGSLDKVRSKISDSDQGTQGDVDENSNNNDASADNQNDKDTATVDDENDGSGDDSSSSDEPQMLPNPMISIYVYPHFDGDDQDYVPGHMAYTKLYKETHFALPGEPTES
jgi:conjugative transfer region lipoprotein (TIGR03751 family)